MDHRKDYSIDNDLFALTSFGQSCVVVLHLSVILQNERFDFVLNRAQTFNVFVIVNGQNKNEFDRAAFLVIIFNWEIK